MNESGLIIAYSLLCSSHLVPLIYILPHRPFKVSNLQLKVQFNRLIPLLPPIELLLSKVRAQYASFNRQLTFSINLHRDLHSYQSSTSKSSYFKSHASISSVNTSNLSTDLTQRPLHPLRTYIHIKTRRHHSRPCPAKYWYFTSLDSCYLLSLLSQFENLLISLLNLGRYLNKSSESTMLKIPHMSTYLVSTSTHIKVTLDIRFFMRRTRASH